MQAAPGAALLAAHRLPIFLVEQPLHPAVQRTHLRLHPPVQQRSCKTAKMRTTVRLRPQTASPVYSMSKSGPMGCQHIGVTTWDGINFRTVSNPTQAHDSDPALRHASSVTCIARMERAHQCAVGDPTTAGAPWRPTGCPPPTTARRRPPPGPPQGLAVAAPPAPAPPERRRWCHRQGRLLRPTHVRMSWPVR